jgi:WD40 repeat protein
MLTAAVLTLILAQTEPEMDYRQTPDAIYKPADPKPGGFASLAISADEKLMVGVDIRNEDLIVWEAATKKEVAKIHQAGCINAAVFSAKGDLLASASNRGTINLTDTKTWKLRDTIKHDGGFYRLAFSPDGTVLLSGGTARNGDLILWDVAKGIRQMRIHVKDNTAVFAVAFAPSGKQFAAEVGTKIKLWDHETCKEIRELPSRASALAFSPDGSKLASVSAANFDPKDEETNVKLWDVATGKELALPIKRHLGHLKCVCWSPDGKRLAVGNGSEVYVIDFEKPKQVIMVDVYGKAKCASEAICFSPDGKYLYAAGGWVTRWKLDAPSEPWPSQQRLKPKK